MSRYEKTNTLDPCLEEWIEERDTPDAGARAEGVDERDRELLAFFAASRQAAPREMSDAEAREVLARVRSRIHRAPTWLRPGRRGAWLMVAAALTVVAIGVATLSRPRTEPQGAVPSAAAVETIKRVSFESVHEGKVVLFQLELTRTR